MKHAEERLVLELPSDAQLGGKMMPLARLLSCRLPGRDPFC